VNFIECQVAVNITRTRNELYCLVVHLHAYFHYVRFWLLWIFAV